MIKKREIYKFLIVLLFLILFLFLPVENLSVYTPLKSSFLLMKEYAREHTFTCLFPAFLIAGFIASMFPREFILKYLGKNTPVYISYPIAGIAGLALSVCSCTILPLFASVYYAGAGIGPAITLLFSGPAVSIITGVMTIKVLGISIGLTRIISSIFGGMIIGLVMANIFEHKSKVKDVEVLDDTERMGFTPRIILFIFLIFLLLSLTLKYPSGSRILKIISPIIFIFLIVYVSFKFFDKNELLEWMRKTLFFTNQILPFLILGVLLSGFFLGYREIKGIVPFSIVNTLVGQNTLMANLISSISGAFMYFATLTEIPILQGFLNAGMHRGPALTLLLSGPAVSLPSMLVIGKVLGVRKTSVYIFLVILLAIFTGYFYGKI